MPADLALGLALFSLLIVAVVALTFARSQSRRSFGAANRSDAGIVAGDTSGTAGGCDSAGDGGGCGD